MQHWLPRGTVTFFFTDVEASTALLRELGATAYARVLADHRRILRAAIAAHKGVEVDTQGDAFFFAFATAPDALAAASEAAEGLAAGKIRVRVGIHTGTPLVTGEGYVGEDVHLAARIGALGHGGQILLSAATASLVRDGHLRDLGEHRLKDLPAPQRVYQLGDGDFPPLASLHATHLPIAATPFLGRERELADLAELLARVDVRLLTLTGPGGTGKTRLAVEAARDAAQRFPHGVWWIPLAALRDPELVPAHSDDSTLQQAATNRSLRRQACTRIRTRIRLLARQRLPPFPRRRRLEVVLASARSCSRSPLLRHAYRHFLSDVDIEVVLASARSCSRSPLLRQSDLRGLRTCAAVQRQHQLRV